MIQRHKQRKNLRWLIRRRGVRWAAAIFGIVALVWFAWAPGINKRRNYTLPQDPYIALGRGAGSTDFPVSEPSSGRLRVVVHPYSVIPGGAKDVAELRRALARDPIVAEHYVGFDFARARSVRLDRDREEYVSYRLGDHIFWTSRKLMLHKGETMITDGNHTSRTRCGNLVAEIAPGPVSPLEPTPEILDTPLPLDLAAPPGPEFEPPPPAEWLLNPPTLDTPPPEVGGGIYIFPPGEPVVVSWPIVPFEVPIPEAGTLVLISSGLVVLWALRKRRRG